MLYVHKILPFFLLPTGIILLLLAGGMLFRRRALCWTGVALFWLASTPLISDGVTRAAENWQVRLPLSEAPSADAIVVLSTGRIQPPGDHDASEWTDADRFFGGVDLYKAEKAPLLLFTGGWAPWRPAARPEGEILIRYAADLGIPRDRMDTTGRVSNTEQESHAVAQLLSSRGAARPRVLLVTSAFHMRRAQLLFARAGIEAVPFPVDFKVPAGSDLGVIHFLPNGGSFFQTEASLRELYGFVFYRFFRS